jgi:hypothetical protein
MPRRTRRRILGRRALLEQMQREDALKELERELHRRQGDRTGIQPRAGDHGQDGGRTSPPDPDAGRESDPAQAVERPSRTPPEHRERRGRRR